MDGVFTLESQVQLADENVFSQEDIIIERYNDQWALIENKKIQYQLFKGTLEENESQLADMVEAKINEINEMQSDLMQSRLEDEFGLRELSNRIVTERLNSAYVNVLKEEYDKKIVIICKESNQNQTNAAKKIYSEYESTMDEFKDKIKNLEDDLEEAREFSKKNAKEIEANWSAKYQKLSDEKNEEITRHLKKSIDLIDENELLENQLEKLYLLIEEKNLQINSLEENVFEYQNEVKKIQLDLQSVDIIGYQYKRNKTKEIAVDTCDFIVNECDCSSNINVSMNDNEVSEILKNKVRAEVAETKIIDDRIREVVSVYGDTDEDIKKNLESKPNESESQQQTIQSKNLKKKLHQILQTDLAYLNKKLQESKKVVPNNSKEANHSVDRHEINSKQKLICFITGLLNETTLQPEELSNTLDAKEINENTLDKLNNLIMLFLNNNSSYDLTSDSENLMFQNMPDSMANSEEERVENSRLDRSTPSLNDSRNVDTMLLKNSVAANQNLVAALTKTLSNNSSIEEHINRRINLIIQSGQDLNFESTSSPRNRSFNNNDSLSNKNLSNRDSNSSPSTSIHDSHSTDQSSRGSSPASLKDIAPSPRLSASDQIDNQNENLPSDLEITPETILQSNLKIQSSVEKVLDMFEDTSKQLVESHFLQNQLSTRLEESQKCYAELQSEYQLVETNYEQAQSELVNKINNLEGLTNAYELDIQAKNHSYSLLEHSLAETKEELEECRNKIKNDNYELTSLVKIKKDLEGQRKLYMSELDDSQTKELVETNSTLMEEKHQLEYKLSRETEMSKMQIKELEQTIEQFNFDNKAVKEKYEEQIYDLKRQIESMDSQIKSEKEFIDTQLMEREQERDEYELKIKSLNETLDRKSTLTIEKEDVSLKNYIQDLEMKSRELEVALEERTNRLNKLSTLNEELERNLHDKEELIRIFPNTIKENELKIDQYKEEIDTMLVANKKQNESLNYLKEKLADAEKLNTELEESNGSMKLEVTSYSEEKDNLQNELYGYMSRFSDLQLHNENQELEHKNSISTLEEKINSLRYSIEEKDKIVEELKAKHNELNEDFERRLDAELNQSKIECDQNVLHINQLKSESEALHEELESLREKLENQGKEFEDEKATADQLSQNLIASKNEEIDELSTTLEKFKSGEDQLKNLIADLEEQLDAAKNDENNLKKIIDDNELEIESFKTAISTIELEKENLQNEINQLKDIEANLEATSVELESKLVDANLALENLQEANEVFKAQSDHYEEEKDKKEIEHKGYIEEIEKLTNENLELTLKLKTMESSSDSNSSPDNSISTDLGQKLKDQVNLTKELDSHLSKQLSKHLKDETAEKELPESIKRINEIIETGEINFLNLSELLEYKAYYFKDQDSVLSAEQAANKVLCELKLRIHEIESERNKLAEEVYILKKLLSNVSLEDLDRINPDNNSKWRNEILQNLISTFQKENELQISELRSFVISNSDCDKHVERISILESRIMNQNQLHQNAFDQLQTLQQSLELTTLNEEELTKLSNKVLILQDNEKQLKKDIKLMEYNKDAEAIKTNDLKESLNIEKSKCIDIMDKLNQEKKVTNSMQEKIGDLNEELEKTKEILNSESEHYQIENNNLQNRINHLREVEVENIQLKDLAKQEKLKIEKLQKCLSDLQNKENKRKFLNMKGNPLNNFERLRQNLEHLAIKTKLALESQSISKQQQIHNLGFCLNDIVRELESMSDATNPNLDMSRSSQYPLSEKTSSINGSFEFTSSFDNSQYCDVINSIEKKWIDQNRDLLCTINNLNHEKHDQESVIQKLVDDVKYYKNKRTETSSLSEHDKEKFKKLYLKYLRAESFRKSLVYQKRFLIIMLSGYEETEREILATLKYESNLCNHSSHSSSQSSSNGSPMYSPNTSPSNTKNRNSYAIQNGSSNQIASRGPRDVHHVKNGTSIYSSRFRVFRAKSRFRTAVISIIAISRIKFLVRKHSGILGKVENHYRR